MAKGIATVQPTTSPFQKICSRLVSLVSWPELRSRTLEFAGYAFVRILIAVVQAMPADMGDAFCRSVAVLAAGPLKIRDKTTSENIRRCFPHATPQECRNLKVAMWHHLILMSFEIAWAQRRLHLSNWSQHVQFRDNRLLLRQLLSDRPTVLVTGHFGNFEIGGYVIGLMGFPTTSIARRLDNRYLNDWVGRFRAARGQFMVDKIGCAPQIDEHLRRGGTLSLLADQHAGDKGCWVDFLGVPASCHKALALFTMSSGAPMIAGYTRRIEGTPMRFESGCVGVADPLDDPDRVCESVTSLTLWYNEQLAEAISLSVEQYWWLHRRWRTPPDQVAKRLEKTRANASAKTQAA
jgi:Kdo2-lipid IVA lauroyltransferase/acyltransferase